LALPYPMDGLIRGDERGDRLVRPDGARRRRDGGPAMARSHGVRHLLTAASFASLLALTTPLGVFAEQIFVLTTGNFLVRFDSATPGTVPGAVATSGLKLGEPLLAIDARPAPGQIYGLGSTNRLYTIDPTTGAATQVGAAGLFTVSGTAFGFDFNP